MPNDYTLVSPLTVVTIPARHLWDTDFLKKYADQLIETDDRPDAPKTNVYWKTNKGEAGQFLFGYQSAWMPELLLEKNNQSKLAQALFSASRRWTVSLHFNKGLAGAPVEEITAAKNTSMNPDVYEAFALAIIAGEGDPAFVGLPGHEPDLNEATRSAENIQRSMLELKKVAPNAGSYLSESNFFEENWQRSFWGSNYSKLLQIKNKYDPDGLFYVHHGVGSEFWSSDGFSKIK
jgi:FAD/FMN-containing dehydrogenase